MASSGEDHPEGRLEITADEAGPTATTPLDSVATVSRSAVIAVVGFSLIAAAVSAVRAVRTDVDDGSIGVVLAASASLLAVAGAVTAFRSLRLAAVPLAVALLMELVVLNEYVDIAPPRLVNVIPLMFALGLVSGRSSTERSPTAGSRQRKVATIVALVLMVPIGFAYLATGLFAPSPDVYGAYALFAFLLGGAVWLARRRSWWVVAVPLVSVGIWPLMVWAGETYLDWSP